MKKLTKLKLNELNKVELEQREMNYLRGGCTVTCRCNCTGSSNAANTFTSNDESNTIDAVDPNCICYGGHSFKDCYDENCPTSSSYNSGGGY